KIGAKIRRATLEKVPYMAIVGSREQQAGSVAVRHRTRGDLGTMDAGRFADALRKEIDSKGADSPLET
ncbi:MAG: hypothetical protein J7M21_06090, partial [Planctomycetes bacterium]|nr:hypothetical protein [Planctomycetota bacterium]